MSSIKNDYNDTVFLPSTQFSMRASLPIKELEMISYWEKIDLWNLLRNKNKNNKKFILHDGPPYANGPIHIGTAANKILKDIINRTMQMEGFDANYIPGWDCHVLPIEWQVEQQYRKKGLSKDKVPIKIFRKECRDFAEKWIKTQMNSFKRLFVLGNWNDPYLTMSFKAEATIIRELGKFLMNETLYRGVKPVMWSPVEKTALAEAEVEYHDITSDSIFVCFPVKNTNLTDLPNVSMVIWTTTPWTIPANRAIAYNRNTEYGIYKVLSSNNESFKNKHLIMAVELANSLFEKCSITRWKKIKNFKGDALKGSVCFHPMYKKGYNIDIPLLNADFVGINQGSGLVHIAPSHGEDDFLLGKKNGLSIEEIVIDNGTYKKGLPLFEGVHVFKADPLIINELEKDNMLLGIQKYIHSYPHSWRSKKPVIFRATPQWFISMDKKGLRDKALKSIENTKWYPKTSINRIRSMVSDRPDWCVSRQRTWGVPITVFINKKTGEPLKDENVLNRIIMAVELNGSDIWLSEDPYNYLGKDYDKKEYDYVTDILDVWFDSGSTHSFVLEKNETQRWPADLYLEGTDQHRGWFQSSLLESCGTRGCAPYKGVLTHGFVLDGEGKKMSKSAGNVVSPDTV